MNEEKRALPPEEYLEPRCPLCEEPFGVTPEAKPVPQKRIIEKMDEYMGRRDYNGAERHLLYWLREARLGRDLRGEFMLLGELVGHYRKTGERDKAMRTADEALALIREMDYENTISAGTMYVNIATACNAFGENERAYELFRKARTAYEGSEFTDPALIGGLMNNMGLACVSLKRFEEAAGYYEKALEVMKEVPGGELEQAITYLNMASAAEEELGLLEGESRIFALLDKAEELLRTPSVPQDGYCAFVLEKCAPAFDYYGYFLTAAECRSRAEAIYTKS